MPLNGVAMKMLCLMKYTRPGPSSRYRLYQFRPYLEAAGIEVDVQPLVDDRYLDELFAGRRSRGYIMGRFVKRFSALMRARRYDLLFVEREIFPYLPALAERLLAMSGLKLVIDIDDAVFLQYSESSSFLKRKLLGNKIDNVLRSSALVLAGNDFLKSYAEKYARNVIQFPTVVDTERFVPLNARPEQKPPVVGWIGNPLTVRWLDVIGPALTRVASQEDFILRLVGSDPIAIDGVNVVGKAWSEMEEVADLRSFDIGIMPLDGSDWCRGKCSLKLLQYMSVGVASVASPTAGAPQIINDGTNGFLAATGEEWEEKLLRLIRSPDLRVTMGQRGREWVEENYNLANYGPRLAEYLNAAAAGEVVSV